MRKADGDPPRRASEDELQTQLKAAHEQIKRLSAGIKEAIAHQTAVSEVLKAMSRSPYALDELLQATIDHGTKLCRAEDGLVYLKVGDELHLRTGSAGGPAEGQAYEVAHPTPMDRSSAVGRAGAEEKTVHITDVLADPDYRWLDAQEIVGYRTLLAVPIRRAGETLGVIAFSRHAVLPFSDREIALVETFADQAAIAIENVRLFQETEAALERQEAISEILRVLSSSPTDITPVLEAIAENALRFCSAEDAVVMLPDGDWLRLAARRGPVPTAGDLRYPNDGTSMNSRAFLDGNTIAIEDLQTSIDFPVGAENARAAGSHAAVVAPLLRDSVAVGTIALRRFDARRFSSGEIAALETFAAQAVIAIENVRLFNETKEALERQTAISDILRVISSSPTDVQPVLNTIAESAARFSNADDAAIAIMHDDGRVMLTGTQNGVAQVPVPFALSHRSVTPRAITEARVFNVPDMEALPDDEFDEGKAYAREHGYRGFLAAPLLKDGRPIGALQLRRTMPGEFGPREVDLVQTFAAQAVIAIENVRLFNETKDALEQQTATSDVLKVISRSTDDLQPVFDFVVENANRLCAADYAFVYLPDGDTFRSVASFGGSPELVEMNRVERRFRDRGSLVGRVALEERAVQIPDVLEDAEYTLTETRRIGGYRTMLGLPMKRGDGALVGIIGMARNEVRPFTAREIQLVETFAQQSVIAIQNVRLFNETKDALERQRATADILYTISTSPTTDQPVLEAVARNALRFCGAEDVLVLLVNGDMLETRAHAGTMRVAERQGGPIEQVPLVRATVSGRATLESRTIHVPDIQSSNEFPLGRELGQGFGEHANLAAPLLQQGKAMGAILLRRTDLHPFGDDEVALAEGFAAQAVIAIENVRLFNETREKSAELEVANRDLATASRHKSEFLANMSHELRTPLNAIIGFSEVLEQRMFGELNERQAEYTRDIATSGRHLLTLVNEILDLAKVEAGRMELELSVFAPAETIRGALGFVRERAAEHGIALEADLPEDLGTLVADERKIRQVLLNLLSNAVKFTPDGGGVTLRAWRRNGELEIAVQDTGVGIAPEDLPRVFEEFQQVGPTTERTREGTGLGLTLAKRFIELHGGRIWVESEIGTGTTFTFAIPVDRAAQPK